MINAFLALVMLSEAQIDLIKQIGVVRVQYVQTGEYGMKANELARAVRTTDGGRYILINLEADLAEMDGWYWHEMAHLAAWEVHGEDIEIHGPEFRQICRQLVKHRPGYFCKGS